jgi:ribosomal protein S18 acetylase RimI-like enzyme
MKSKDLKILRKKLTKANRIDNDPLISFEKEALNLGIENSDGPAKALSVEFVVSTRMLDSQLKACLSLFEKNMGDLYRNSSWGLDMDEKTEELKHENARFLLLMTGDDTMGGFVHFRFDYDDDEHPTRAVLYLYEIQIDEQYHRQGLGKKVMAVLEKIAGNAEVSHVVLTVFKANVSAINFYEKLEYAIDETDPINFNEPVDYKILSRSLK